MQKSRPQALFGNNDTNGSFYDAKSDYIKPRLDAGVPKLKKMQPRKSDAFMNPSTISCVNIEKANMAKTHTLKPKQIVLSNFKTTCPRDDSILK